MEEIQGYVIRQSVLFDNGRDMLMTIDRCDLALPYIIECSEIIHTWLKTLPNYTETMMYCWHKTIAEFAFVSDEDKGTYWRYQQKLDEMTGKDFELNI